MKASIRSSGNVVLQSVKECIPVECVPSAAVAISSGGCLPEGGVCWGGGVCPAGGDVCQTSPCGQNDRHL